MVNHPSLKLRNGLRPTDRTILLAAVRETGFFYPDELLIAEELIDIALTKGEEESGYLFIVAEIDGHVAGYTCYGPVPLTEGSFDLYWIVIHPSFQRRGIGRALVDASENDILTRGGKRVYIETSGRELYKPTVSFYERCGYRCEACLKDFYRVGDDKQVFSKSIS